jgi:hypothetical protein
LFWQGPRFATSTARSITYTYTATAADEFSAPLSPKHIPARFLTTPSPPSSEMDVFFDTSACGRRGDQNLPEIWSDTWDAACPRHPSSTCWIPYIVYAAAGAAQPANNGTCAEEEGPNVTCPAEDDPTVTCSDDDDPQGTCADEDDPQGTCPAAINNALPNTPAAPTAVWSCVTPLSPPQWQLQLLQLQDPSFYTLYAVRTSNACYVLPKHWAAVLALPVKRAPRNACTKSAATRGNLAATVTALNHSQQGLEPSYKEHVAAVAASLEMQLQHGSTAAAPAVDVNKSTSTQHAAPVTAAMATRLQQL